jgi:hypothetical protein
MLLDIRKNWPGLYISVPLGTPGKWKLTILPLLPLFPQLSGIVLIKNQLIGVLL